MDRNTLNAGCTLVSAVALRKESVDRNIPSKGTFRSTHRVALRKESVDRNFIELLPWGGWGRSLSARRAWIEMVKYLGDIDWTKCRSPQGERG